MSYSFTTKNKTFGGAARPLVCAPLTGENAAELSANVAFINSMTSPPDVIEWRADAYGGTDYDARLAAMRVSLPNTPLIFTLRAADEGGFKTIPDKEREKIYENIIKTHDADVIDVEYASPFRDGIIRAAKDNDVKVIVSFHDFKKTPSKDEMPVTLNKMRETGCDIVKIAVTPNCMDDVLALLAASTDFYKTSFGFPAITISMGDLGKITRVAGGAFGSVLTFGALQKESAPGQLPSERLSEITRILYSRD